LSSPSSLLAEPSACFSYSDETLGSSWELRGKPKGEAQVAEARSVLAASATEVVRFVDPDEDA
jgi:hypothetical protein